MQTMEAVEPLVCFKWLCSTMEEREAIKTHKDRLVKTMLAAKRPKAPAGKAESKAAPAKAAAPAPKAAA